MEPKKKKSKPRKPAKPRSWTGFATTYGERVIAVAADGESIAHVTLDRVYRVRRVRITVIA